jgi:hypothetical protein
MERLSGQNGYIQQDVPWACALGEELASSSSFSAGCLNWRRFVIAVIDFVRL